MATRFRLLLLLALAANVAVAAGVANAVGTLHSQVGRLEEQTSQMQTTMLALSSVTGRLARNVSSQIDDLDSRVSGLFRQAEEAESKLSRVDDAVDDIEVRLDDVEVRLLYLRLR